MRRPVNRTGLEVESVETPATIAATVSRRVRPLIVAWERRQRLEKLDLIGLAASCYLQGFEDAHTAKRDECPDGCVVGVDEAAPLKENQ